MTDTSSTPISVFCVDDLQIICSTLSSILNAAPPFHCVGVALAPDEALDQMMTLHPDLAIIDLIYVQGTGFMLLDQMRIHLPATRVVVYSALDDATCAKRCLQQGALGYVSKSESLETLLGILTEVSQGKTMVSPQVANLILHDYSHTGEGLGDVIARLTAVELSIFLMLGQAMSTHEIARRLCKSPKTIEAHKRQARQKLGISNGMALTQTATKYLAGIG